MKTRGCTSQRKTTKVSLAPPRGRGPRVGSLLPRPAPAPPPGPVPAELLGAPLPFQTGGTGTRTPRDPAENSRPSPSRAGFSGACVSYEIRDEGEKFPKWLLLSRFFAFAWKAQLPGPPHGWERGLRCPPAPWAWVSRLAPGAAGSARAHPAPGRPALGPPPGSPITSRGPCLGQRALGVRECRYESPLLAPTPLLHPPTSPCH